MGSRLVTAVARHMTLVLLWQAIDRVHRIASVPCTNHSLNLACVHAAFVEVHSVIFFGTLDRLFSFFSAYTYRWDVFIQVTGLTIKWAVETRWSSREDAVNVVKKFSEVPGAAHGRRRNCNHKIRCIFNSRLGTVVFFASFVSEPLEICFPRSQ